MQNPTLTPQRAALLHQLRAHWLQAGMVAPPFLSPEEEALLQIMQETPRPLLSITPNRPLLGSPMERTRLQPVTMTRMQVLALSSVVYHLDGALRIRIARYLLTRKPYGTAALRMPVTVSTARSKQCTMHSELLVSNYSTDRRAWIPSPFNPFQPWPQ